MKKRWYDKHPVGKYLNNLKEMSKKDRDPIVFGILNIIKETGDINLDDLVMDFPLETFKRRWYDADPYLWLIFNGLQTADIDLLNSIEQYLKGVFNKKQ